jgi:hypothetical protein
MFKPPKNVINIMADFGMGPYGWINESVEGIGVGGNFADTTTGFGDKLGIKISSSLEEDFADWVIVFECCYDHRDFNWNQFNARGVQLSRRLKREVHDSFYVRYHRPCEDRYWEDAGIIIIEEDEKNDRIINIK